MLSKELSNKILNELYLEIPEFKTYVTDELKIDNEDITGYLILDDFGSYLKILMRKNNSLMLIDRCFLFINHLATFNDKDIEEWLKSTFLESMMNKGAPRQLSRSKLQGKALILFEEVISNPFFGG